LEKLKKNKIEIKHPSFKIQNLKLKGKIFVLSGSLEIMTRAQAKEKIRNLGGEISELVSKKTDFIVVGKNPGSKLKKAKELGIKIIKENQFLEIIKN
jgi:DNA ligase (NAD+)